MIILRSKSVKNSKVTALATKHEQTTQLGYLANTPAQNSKANDSKYELTAPLDSTKFMAGQTLNVMITQTGVQIPKTSVKDGHVYVVENKKLSGSQLQERHLMEVLSLRVD